MIPLFQVRLIIIDSIACHFRQEFEGANVRSWTLNDIVVVLRRLAARNIAVGEVSYGPYDAILLE